MPGITSGLGHTDNLGRSAFQISELEVVINSQADGYNNLDSHEDTEESAGSKQRSLLIYDEVVPITILLRSPCSKKVLEMLLHDIELSISAHVSSTGQPPEQDNRPAEDLQAKYLLDSKVISSGTALPEVESSDDESRCVAVWRSELHLRHPERQMYRPAIQITASASLANNVVQKHVELGDEYMLSGIPLPENLLHGLQSGPAFADVNLQLPVSRIQKVVPRSTAALTELRPIRGTSRQTLVVPALTIKMAKSMIGDQTLLSLEVEVAKWPNCDVVIEHVGGYLHASEMSPMGCVDLPQTMKVGDKAVFLYNLPSDSSDPSRLDLNAKVMLNDECHPQLQIRRIVNPQSNMLCQSQAIITRHWQRPTSQTSRPASMIAPDRGMSFSISGPTEVREGETFLLNIFIVNRSLKKRRVALLAVTDSQKSRTRVRPRSTFIGALNTTDLAPAIVENNSLYRTLTNTSHSTQAEIISLTADAKAGPLVPGACHNVRLEFLTLSSGVVGLDVLTVVDLDTKETVHINELPSVMAVEHSAVSTD